MARSPQAHTRGSSQAKTALNVAAARLRATVLAHADGALLGSEDDLQSLLGVSKPTMRQAARLIEREGLLRVKRGNNGGYFSARPDPAFIESMVSNYLEALHAEPEDLTRIASVLWVEVVRKAAAQAPEYSRAPADRWCGLIQTLPDNAGFSEVLELEQVIRADIFQLIRSPYVELIFRINTDFARRRFSEPPSARDDTPAHRAFVTAWCRTKSAELRAIADGDQEIAMVLARRARELLYRRIWP